MNDWGVDECTRNIETIKTWLMERNKMSETSARRLVAYAIHQAKAEG